MQPRKSHVWEVELQRDDGEVGTFVLEAYWDPAKEFVRDGIGAAAAAVASFRTKFQHKFVPVTVKLRT